jgi:DNA repair protein RadC
MNQQDQATIQAALAVLDKHLKHPGQTFASPAAVQNYLRLTLQTEDREVFFVMFLDTRNCLIEGSPMFVGTLTQAAVYPREVARKALALNAASVIVAHNHPSGNPEPSTADERMTKQMRAALELIDVRVLDHIIIAGAKSTSFAERGLL